MFRLMRDFRPSQTSKQAEIRVTRVAISLRICESSCGRRVTMNPQTYGRHTQGFTAASFWWLWLIDSNLNDSVSQITALAWKPAQYSARSYMAWYIRVSVRNSNLIITLVRRTVFKILLSNYIKTGTVILKWPRLIRVRRPFMNQVKRAGDGFALHPPVICKLNVLIII